MVRNPSFPQPDLHTADQLFVNGVLLPLQNLPHQSEPKPDLDPHPEPDSKPKLEPELAPAPSSTAPTSSKRWKDIFRKADKKSVLNASSGNDEYNNSSGEKDKEIHKEKEAKNDKKNERKKKDKKGVPTTMNGSDLNINIWPFSRSRSAGNSGGGRTKAPIMRKVSSAPCSRSNSRGESSKPRKWPSSPGRAGLHLGRSSPVWQVRRSGSANTSSEQQAAVRSSDKGGAPKEGSGARRGTTGNSGHARVLNLNVPLCIGYRQHLSCRSDDHNHHGAVAGRVHSSSNNSGSNNHHQNDNNGNVALFNLRTLFSKKVY